MAKGEVITMKNPECMTFEEAKFTVVVALSKQRQLSFQKKSNSEY